MEHLNPTNTFAIPNDPVLRLTHDVYKPSAHTIGLLSEQGRTVYPEAFIENPNLGTLVDLCVRALARAFGPDPLPIIAKEPLLLQVHYDALDVTMPLEKCWHIQEERFWKRLVLTKHPDKTLVLKRDVKWKNNGVSLKYVELVEECAAEYWPEDEMINLAIKVKDFVNEMHIKRLQSLKDRSFEKYFRSESESSSSDENDKEGSTDRTESSVPTSEEEEEQIEVQEEEKTESQLELQKQLAFKKSQRKKARRELREAKLKAKEEKELKRKRREARRARRVPPKEKPQKKRIRNPKSFFAIELSSSEDDGEDQIIDKRNIGLYLKHLKRYNYPPEHCHHIDLSFVQYFTNLESFTIEFLGPILNFKYHDRHMNFSHDDIKRLARGISLLPKLRVFRLRNSRMDTEKLITICRALGQLENLELVDFGCDNLDDDCGIAFADLFKTNTSLSHLEFESNLLGEQALRRLGKALNNYTNGHVEYLGLARNPINDQALHAIISNIIGTKHISTLNLRGAKHLTEIGLSCCIAQELLRKHPALIKLDLCAVKISQFAADEIVKAMDKNKNVMEFNIFGCDLDEESQNDIRVILERNRYIAENPYLRDQNTTTEEVEAWLNRSKNPIFLKVKAEREKNKECLQNRPKEFIPSPLESPESSQVSLNASQISEQHLTEYSSFDINIAERPKPSEPFVYAANQFNDKEFLEHVYQPGPEERHYYFQMRKQKFVVRDNVKNISMA